MYADREGSILLSLFQKSRTIKELGAIEQGYLGSDNNIGCSAAATILPTVFLEQALRNKAKAT